MAAKTLIPLELDIAGNRYSQTATLSHNPPLSPQELPGEGIDPVSPKTTQGLRVVVNINQEVVDHGLYPVVLSSTASSPQTEKILWMGPYADVTQTEKVASVRNSRPSSGYFIPKTRVRRCLIITAITIVIVGIILGLVAGLTGSGNMQQVLSNSLLHPASGPISQQANVTISASLYDDTSIAAFESEDRQRHVFYQTINGSIQHAIYSGEWSFQDVGVVDARNHTPLSALSGNDGTIYLFYITNDNILTSREIVLMSSRSYPTSIPLRISPQTRQLTAARIPSYDGDASDFQLFVLTQRPSDGVSMIHLSTNSTRSSFRQRDVTADLNGSNSTEKLVFNCPSAVAVNISGGSYAPFLSAKVDYTWIGVFSNKFGNPTNNFIGAGYDGKQLNSSKFGATLPTSMPSTSYGLEIAVIHGQMSILQVNNGTLISSGETNSNLGSVKNHDSPYPFTRLGTFLSVDGSYYAYHQLDGSTIAEAVYDPITSWTTSNITIHT